MPSHSCLFLPIPWSTLQMAFQQKHEKTVKLICRQWRSPINQFSYQKFPISRSLARQWLCFNLILTSACFVSILNKDEVCWIHSRASKGRARAHFSDYFCGDENFLLLWLCHFECTMVIESEAILFGIFVEGEN